MYYSINQSNNQPINQSINQSKCIVSKPEMQRGNNQLIYNKLVKNLKY